MNELPLRLIKNSPLSRCLLVVAVLLAAGVHRKNKPRIR